MLKVVLRHCGHYEARSDVEKAQAFAKLLADVFQPPPSEDEPEEEIALIQLLESPYQLEPPIKRFKRAEVQEDISNLNQRNHRVRSHHW
jgi:hypothetical protein